MALNKQSLSQTQTQRLGQVLSPQQVRYFRLLEMNESRFQEEVRREVDDNPALEMDSPDAELMPGVDEDAEASQIVDYQDDGRSAYRPGVPREVAPWMQENIRAPYKDAVYDDLLHQLSILQLSPAENLIARYIIGNLDSAGYLRRSTSDIATDIENTEGIEVTPQQVRAVLKKVQALDPPGIAAVDLRDCLMLQLQRKAPSRQRDDALLVITHYFDIFARRNFKLLAREANLTPERLTRAIDLIKTLNPKPGSLLQSDDPTEALSAGIIPDFLVENVDGKLRLTMPSAVPALHLSETFTPEGAEKELGSTARDRNVQQFIRKQQNNASGFIDIVELRRRTLMRIMHAIVEIQTPFFLTGDKEDIKPMILKDIKARTGDDLSVISRATNGKYVETQYGIFPLKFFFNEEFGDNISSRTIAERLRRLIEEEDARHPLSDAELARLMNEQGFPLARRTVAKYREQLSIPSSRMRQQL